MESVICYGYRMHKQKLILSQPYFAGLLPDESRELLALLTEVEYKANEVIVAEAASVDSIYFIAKGEAEVQQNNVLVAKLVAGEAIGMLAQKYHTSTVTALTPMHLLKLDLREFSRFLKRYPHMKSMIAAAETMMLRMKLIKHALPFQALSMERTASLATKIETINVQEKKIIFKKGDEGNSCYLLCSGQVEVYLQQEDHSEKRLAVLKAGGLFGEATLITRMPRNVNVRTLEPCQLLVLKRKYLLELLESEKNVAKIFMHLMVDRHRPTKNAAIIEHFSTTVDEQQIVVLQNPATRQYFKLSEQGWVIWKHLDGQHTLQDITMTLADEFHVFAPDIVAALIFRLAKAGLVDHVSAMRPMIKILKAFGEVDNWLSHIYQKAGKFLFTRLSQTLLTVAAFFGTCAFYFSTNTAVQTISQMPNKWILIPLLFSCMVGVVALHELGHALTTKSFGYAVNYVGISLRWLFPVAFIDTSDMWLSTPGPRMAVNIAGVCANFIVAGISALFIYAFSNPFMQAVLWVFALLNYIHGFRMLNPLRERDGYHVLTDLFSHPQLRKSAIRWLVKDFLKTFKRLTSIRDHKVEIIYWLFSLIFLIVISLLTLFIQSCLFKIIGFHPANVWMNLSLPILVALISSSEVIVEIHHI